MAWSAGANARHTLHVRGVSIETRFLEENGRASSWFGSWTGPGLVAVSSDTLYVAYRGTYSATDALADARATMTPYKIGDSQFGFVHRGFHDIWAASQLVEVAAREMRGRKRIVFTGHSLGGALAQLAALQFAATVGRVPVVYTFGSPRVGDAQWRAAAQSSGFHFHFKHDHDVVPEVPLWGRKPWALTPSWYTHASDAAVRLLETPRTYQCIREFGPTGLDGIADHSLQHYSTLLIDAARN